MTLRLHNGREADAVQTPLEGAVLGWLAVLMLGVFLLIGWLLPLKARTVALKIAQIWVAGLFCFFAGVHRGASFYEPEGPRLSDPLIFLTMHFGGLTVALLRPSKAWTIAAPGMLLTLAGDMVLAREKRLPGFFLRLRPLQLLVATVFVSGLGALARADGARGA